MSNTTQDFLKMCVQELGITRKVLLEDIAFAYEKWQKKPHFTEFAGDGIKTAWLGPVDPEGHVPGSSYTPIGAIPLNVYVEDDEDRAIGFQFLSRRPFEQTDFKLVLGFLKREMDLDDKALPDYFQKMYKINIAPVHYALDPAKPPFDWYDTALWNLRWIIKGLDMESPQKKHIYLHIQERLQDQWSRLQAMTQQKWNAEALALLRLDEASDFQDYREIGGFLAQAGPELKQGLAKHPWLIGILTGKSKLPERERYNLTRLLKQAMPLDQAVQEILGISQEGLARLEGKKLSAVAGDLDQLANATS